jgi:hypothetical protein
MTPLEDLFWTRTKRDRVGTIRDGSNHVLLLRDLDRLIGQGLIKRTSDVREISADSREKIFYQELASGDLYVYVAPWERGGPEFRRYSEFSLYDKSYLVQKEARPAPTTYCSENSPIPPKESSTCEVGVSVSSPAARGQGGRNLPQTPFPGSGGQSE